MASMMTRRKYLKQAIPDIGTSIGILKKDILNKSGDAYMFQNEMVQFSSARLKKFVMITSLATGRFCLVPISRINIDDIVRKIA